MKFKTNLFLAAAFVSLCATTTGIFAAPIYKTNNSNSLNLTTSWSITSGAQTPNPAALTATDAWYFNEVTMLGSKTVALGGDMTIGGLALDYVTSNSANDLTISGGNLLTLAGTSLYGSGVSGSGGIYTAAGIVLNRGAGGSLTINANVALSANQQWVTSRNLTVNGTIALGAFNLPMNMAGGTSLFSNVISGTGKVTKYGAGTLTLNADNTFSGGFQLGPDAGASNTGVVNAGHANALGTTTVISRGTQLRSSVADLAIPNNFTVGAGGFRLGGTNNFTLSGTTTVDNNSRSIANYGTAIVTLGNIDLSSGTTARAAFDAATGTINVNGIISGQGGVTVSNGKTRFNGANTYTGTTLVSAGQIAGTGTIPTTLTMSGGSFALAGGATTTGLTLANGATFTGTPSVTFDSPPLAATTYDIFNYTGTVTGGTNLSANYRGTITDTGSKYTFTLSGQNQVRTWNTTTGTWDSIGANALWVEGDHKFFSGDSAIFNEPSAASTVTLSGTITASGFSVNNTSNAYTFTGGALTGATGLTKTGAGAMTIGNGNTFTGNVLVSGGSVTGTGGVPSANTNSSFGLKADTRTITAQDTGTIWLTATNGSSNTFGGGSMVTSQIPTLIAKDGGTIRTGRFNTIGNVVLQNGGRLTNSSTETGGSYQGFQFNGDFTVSGTGAGTFIDNNANHANSAGNHLRGGVATNFNVADVTASALADLTVNSALRDGSPDYAGIGSLTKSGSGKMILSGVNTYTGPTTISGGTLEISGQLGAGTYASDISNAGTLSFSSNSAQSVWGIISGAGSLEKSGAGVLTLTGAQTFTGPVSINGGTLVVTETLAPAATVTVNSGGTLKGTGIVQGDVTVTAGGTLTGGDGATGALGAANLTFTGGATVNMGALDVYQGYAPVEVSGNLAATGATGAVVFNLPAAAVPAGTYHLISSSNTLPNAAKFSIGSAPLLGARQAGSLVANPGFIDYVVSGVNPTWTGESSGEWSTAVLAAPKNWFTNVITDYIQGDAVTFDDTALGTTTITLPGMVSPASVIFNNWTLDYSIGGPGSIAGTGQLTKSGTATVTLNTANTFAGTTLTDGTLVMGNPAALGTGPLTSTGGTLGGTGTITGPVGGTQLTTSGPGIIQLLGVNTYTGPTIVSGGLKLGGSSQLGSGTYAGTITNDGTLIIDSTANQTLSGAISGTGALIKSNTGTLILSANNPFTGNTTVDGGILNLTGGGGAAGTIRGSAVVNSGASLWLTGGDATGYNGGASALTTITLDGGTLHNNADAKLAGFNQTLGSAVINLIGGSITGVAGSNLDFFLGGSAVNSYASSTTSTISGTALDLRQGQGVVFNVEPGSTPSGVDLEISSLITNKAPTATGPGTGTSYGNNPLIKSGGGTMKLTGASNYTGSTTINAGTLDLASGSIYNGGYNNSAIVTVNLGALLKLSSFGYNDGNSLGQLADYATRRVINGGTIEVKSPTQSIGNDFTVTAAGGTFRYNPAVTTDTLTLLGNPNSNIPVAGALTLETVGNIAIAEVIEGAGGLVKTGTATLTLSGLNTYTGNTTVNAGSMQLADNAELKFVIGANHVSNRIDGSGTASLAGDFNLDLTGANATSGNSWNLVNVATLSETFQPTFTVVGFSKSGAIHTKIDGTTTWTFSETTGNLTVSSGTDFDTWIALYPTITNPADKLPAADPDGDGLSNRQEYAFGLNPSSGSSVSPITTQINKTTGVFSYTRRKPSLTGLTYKIWTSTDLSTWTEDTGAVQTPTDNGDNQSVAVTLSGAPLTAPKVFVRVAAQ